MQEVRYPQNHVVNSVPNYNISQQNYPNYTPASSLQGPFGTEAIRLEKHLSQEGGTDDVGEETAEDEEEVKNKETLQFEEALKQWVNR
ncbi:hypothetical protein NQ318_010023 [Aromia moschata]|uniref:Uncharacterized protein n=1 Tax=Aromia moschata TaxID=1265417 RepID=A0AAV8YBN1_9CUCU|nr:hypothetical protein NQ318_010023 [Aromia moschata]